MIFDQLVPIPHINPGDTVWWHADLIHSVESHHLGKEPNSVLYIPAGPDCPNNRDYLRRMRHAFILGQTPPDFPANNYEVEYKNRATLVDLRGNEGRKLMGFQQVMEEQQSEQTKQTCPAK